MNTSSAINGTIDAMTDFANPPIGWQHKAFGTDLEGRDGSDLEPLGISALDGNLLLPVMTLNRAAIAHNVDLMAQFCLRPRCGSGASREDHDEPRTGSTATRRRGLGDDGGNRCAGTHSA